MTTSIGPNFYTRAYKISDQLRDLFIESVQLSEQLANPEAENFLKHGAGRRLRLMWDGYRLFLKVIPPNRVKPLQPDEIVETNLHLNSVYMHLRGSLDNFAWSLIWEKRDGIADKISGSKVGLFFDCIKKDSVFSELWRDLSPYEKWATELKKLRDPVAHRIPLGIVPSILTEEEGEKYSQYYLEANEAASHLDFDKADDLHDKMSKIGKFVPLMVHDYDEGTIPVYPTITDDIEKFTKVGQLVLSYLSA